MSISKESLISEKDQLDLKIQQLQRLSKSKEFGSVSINEAKLVKKQLASMKQYLSILKQRLDLQWQLQN